MFYYLGHRVSAIDGSEEICHAASEYTGIDVKCMVFGAGVSLEELHGPTAVMFPVRNWQRWMKRFYI